MWKAVAAFLFFVCLASAVAAGTVRVPLVPEPFRLVTGAAEFVFALPRHATPQPGSELTLVLRFGNLPQGRAEALPVFLNDRPLQPRFSAETAALALRIDAAVPETMLQEGWNRIVAVLPPQFATCEVRRAESFLNLSFTRLSLFPELRRFPESMVEETLLRSTSDTPVVSLLLPTKRRDVHLRACAIAGARFGQASYLRESDCEVGEIPNWPSVENRNALIVARWDELGNLPLAEQLADKLAALPPGRGMLAEFIVGSFPNERRWILATGSDDAGVEKALLTLGSQAALNALAPSPVEILTAPEISPQVEARAKPASGRGSFRDLGWRDFEVTHLPEHRSWRLPPGHVLEDGELMLKFFHPQYVASGTIEVLLGATRVGSIALTPENAEAGATTLKLPENLPGSDPIVFTFRATSTNAQTARPRATILGNSTLDATVAPARISGLQHLDTLLVRDSFLRRTAMVLPGEPDLDQLKLLFDLSMHLGRRLPSSPVLWPQVCSFDANRKPDAERVRERSVLLLAPMNFWSQALPPGTRLFIEQVSRDTVRIQGRSSSMDRYEPTLTFLQMIRSPWSSEEWLITAGGWNDLDLPTLKSVLISGATDGRLYGNMAAVDRLGRFAAYDSRRPSVESFPQRLLKNIPPALNLEETMQRNSQAAVRREQSLWVNSFLFWFAGIFILTIVFGRLLLVWERTRQYKKLGQQETL